MLDPLSGSSPPDSLVQALPLSVRSALTMEERLLALHTHMRCLVPQVDRLACALYDPDTDHLKTFVHSMVEGDPWPAYQYKLSHSASLSQMVKDKNPRMIDHTLTSLRGDAPDNQWLRGMGFQSSYTMPMFHQQSFEGFIFLDSLTSRIFTSEVVGKLKVYLNLVLLMVSHQLTAIQSLMGSVRGSRELPPQPDDETGWHLERMSHLSRLIARGLSVSHNLSDDFIEQLFLFAPLHDIGKVFIPAAIRNKPDVFTTEERRVMQQHVQLGSNKVESMIEDYNLGALTGITILRNLVAGHHEMMDGSGYPKGRSSGPIPLEARIVTVADIFDALTSERVYKKEWGFDEAFATLDKMANHGKIDSACVEALRRSRQEASQIMMRYGKGTVPRQTT